MSTLSRVTSKLLRSRKHEDQNDRQVDPASQIRDTFSIFLLDVLTDLESQRKKSHIFDPKLFGEYGITPEAFNPDDKSSCEDEDPHPNRFFVPMNRETHEIFTPDLNTDFAKEYHARIGELHILKGGGK
ncbi:hypothetical protein UA08_00959 [Talaromyces atroroseus]|uniref:Uncharacterized protein n=1 Tax=Talaromyces atroroseus TaxID=1441469 RepID=A0A225BAH5_TALAT|nr:hypothetical protein UA08_00959 [Talaromyces atroroseus]OKL64386.1 hypothetical protein UA08_00959 [Talaromyces atroroseus]